jgi:quercetin dioxygenase-like cupin family protein
MIRVLSLASALALAGSVAMAAPPAQPVTKTLHTLKASASGQPLVAPKGPVEVTVSETTVPSHGKIATHKHPYPRYVYVAEGRLKVTDEDTGRTYELKAGDYSVDPVNQWHSGVALGDGPVRLITVDQTPPGVSNVIKR